MTRIADLLTLIGDNAVPAAGWFVGHWSGGTYWADERAEKAQRRDRNEEPWVSRPGSRDPAAP